MPEEEEYDEYRLLAFQERAARSNERPPGQMSDMGEDVKDL
ncbi:MAG TPA: hypothetical protein VIY48_19180 [Candidatus Paceibacterota bacterium]